MRYYFITITEPGSNKELLRFTSHPRGNEAPPDPGALQIEFDLQSLPQGQAAAGSYVRIWGIPLNILTSGFDFAKKNCTILGGMGKGFPLANPSQAGLLAGGQVIQCFGNWIGTEMTLDILLQPGYAPEAKQQEPRNAAVNWPANTPMRQMIDRTLATAYPGLRRNIRIDDDLKLPNPETAFYSNIPQFAQYAKNLSRMIKGASSYTGVEMTVHGDTVYVYDNSKSSNDNSVKQIGPLDLIGQPTWIGPKTVQAMVVMRGDIRNGQTIKLPESLITTRASSLSTFSPLRDKSSFSGNFFVQKLRHVGNFRQSDGRAWCTIIDGLSQDAKDFSADDLGPGYGVQTGPNAV